MSIPNSIRRFRTLAGTAGVATLVFSGCDPSVFVDLKDQAPVVSFRKPDGFDGESFGATVAAMEGLLGNGEPATRLAVGGGAGSATTLYNVWNIDTVGSFAITNTACEDTADDCAPLTGTALAGIPRFAGEGTCVAIGEAAEDRVRVRCETDPTTLRLADPGPGASPGLELGTSIAAVPEELVATTRGVMLVGAPGSASERGSVFRVEIGGGPGSAVEVEEIANSPGVVDEGARLGQVIATAALPSSFASAPGLVAGTAYLAVISAPVQNRVVLAAIGVDALDATDIDGVVLACFDGTDGFGGALTAGDVTGDGLPEVYMGFGEFALDHPGEVHVFDLADLTTLGSGCTDTTAADDPETSILTCPPLDAVGDADCSAGGFGSALALGDVDADGVLDLIAGAPKMKVDNQDSAGGVFALAGSSTGVDMSRASFMRVSNPRAEARLGASVAALRTHYSIPDVTERHEVAAGAPGAGRAFIFLCSGLGADVSTTGSRCIEQAPE